MSSMPQHNSNFTIYFLYTPNPGYLYITYLYKLMCTKAYEYIFANIRIIFVNNSVKKKTF